MPELVKIYNSGNFTVTICKIVCFVIYFYFNQDMVSYV